MTALGWVRLFRRDLAPVQSFSAGALLAIASSIGSAYFPSAAEAAPLPAAEPEGFNEFSISPASDLSDRKLTVPSGKGEVIADVRYVSDSQISPAQLHGITQSFALQPGDIYNPELALADLKQFAELSSTKRATLTLEPADEPNRVAVVMTADRPNSFFFGFGNLPRPTALPGPVRPSTVRTLSNRASGFALRGYVGFDNLGGNNQRVTLGAVAGENVLGAELDFRQFFDDGSGYGVNFENRRGIEPEFDGGEIEVDTPNGDDPWVHRLGGGAEYFRQITPDLEVAAGVSYQRVSVRDDLFTSDVVANDQLGNTFTVSDSGQDDLLAVNFTGNFDRRNDPELPTRGYRVLFGIDQTIPIGDADILFNRLSANYSHYIPLNLFGFTEGPRTLALNVQGGTIIGDTPPYEAFSLGGTSSVRGYGLGEVGTGKSFLQATAEYRFPVLSLNIFQDDVAVGGTLFFDYATDLGTGDDVISEPAEARDKPGDGFGYGLGVRAVTSAGIVRLEFGINDQGGSEFTFGFGDRF